MAKEKKPEKSWFDQFEWDELINRENKYPGEEKKPKKHVTLDGGFATKSTPSLQEALKKERINDPKLKSNTRDSNSNGAAFDRFKLSDDQDWGDRFSNFTEKAEETLRSLKQKTTLLFKNLHKRLPDLVSDKRVWVGTACILVVVVVGLVILNPFNDDTSKEQAENTENQGAFSNNPADFYVLRPGDNPNVEIGFDSQRRMASYSSQISGVEVVISQQPMPDNFKLDPAAGADKIAKDFGANQAIEANDVKAYLGYSSEAKQQTVVFTKNGNLVFMNAKQELDVSELLNFIQRMQ